MKMYAALVAALVFGAFQAAYAVELDTDSETFLKRAAAGSMGEVELGRWALERSRSDSVKKFAQHMVSEHTNLNKDLESLADRFGMTLPAPMSKEQTALKDKLSKLEGNAFDREFMRGMITDHEAMVADFERYMKDGRNEDVRAFAKNALPALKDHLAMARDTEKGWRGAMLDERFDRPVDARFETTRKFDVSYDRPYAEREVFVSAHGDGCCEEVRYNSCCEESQEIVYDNDWRAGTVELIHESFDGDDNEECCW
jgi:predicted outer membrane protein